MSQPLRPCGTLDPTKVRARILELIREADRKNAARLAALRETFA